MLERPRGQHHSVAPTYESRRIVFRRIAQLSYVDWPTYESSPLFDRTSLLGLVPVKLRTTGNVHGFIPFEINIQNIPSYYQIV
jgi:hypothetical protein